MNLIRRIILTVFPIWLIVAVMQAQTPPPDFMSVIMANEVDRSHMHEARLLAVAQDIPINVQIPGVALIEAAIVHDDGEGNSTVIYTVITDFREPDKTGYTADYEQVKADFDLTNAIFRYNLKNENSEGSNNRWLSNPTVLPPEGVILVTDQTNDRVMAMNRFDGSLVDADFIPDDGALLTPIASQPDLSGVDFVYVSDQLGDVVYQYDAATGDQIGIFAPAGGSNTAILDNIRGTEWSPEASLLVTIGAGANDDGIAEFDAAGNYVGNKIANGAGGLDSPFDILWWQTEGVYAVSAITSDAIHIYDADGNYMFDLYDDAANGDLAFPEQITEFSDGTIGVAEFTDNVIHVLDINGLIETIDPVGLTLFRGVYRLGNGNYLVTTSSGTHIVAPDGNVIQTVITGAASYIHDFGTPLVGGDGECGFICPQDITINLEAGECEEVVNYNLIDTGNCAGLELVLLEGLESGSAFPEGVTTVSYQYVDSEGEIIAECSFDVIVNAYGGPVLTALGCNDLVNISVDTNCMAIIGADIILEGGPYACYDDYEVFIDDMPGVNINGQSLTFELGLHTVTVSDPTTGNSCWGQVMIEDKLAPELICFESIVYCTDSTDPVFEEPEEAVLVQGINLNLPVGPDAGDLTTAELNVSTPGFAIITDINVTVDIDHTFSADLEVFIVGPDGTQVELATDVCGAADNWDNVTFDDAADMTATASCTGGDPALLGSVQPEGSLADFNGLQAGGVYTLLVNDDLGGDGGNLNFFSVEITYLVLAPYAPIPTDNCDTDVELSYTDQISGDNCDTLFITRTWVGTDNSGNTGTCVQTIKVLPLELEIVECPEDFIGECGDDIDPDITGYPTVNDTEIVEGGVCNIFVGFWDKEIADCGGGVKIVRTWEILDWCTQETVECKQVLKLQDTEGPEIECPEDITVSSDPWFCNTDVVVPQPEVEDACGTPYTLTLDAGALQPQVSGTSPFHVINDVPVGEHVITWIATDACGNSSSCTFTITVVDDIPPVAACDEHTIVSVIEDHLYDRGLTKIPATVLDDGSYDNCGEVTFQARRMDSCIDFDWTTNGAGIDEIPNGFVDSRDRGTVHRELIPFACCDVHTTVMVELQVTDEAGNVNFCMVEVEVQDKLAPFVICPPDVTVSCEFWFAAEATAGFIPQEQDQLTPVFGRILDAYEYDESDRQPVIIDDPGNNQIPQPHNWGLDGWADDNCNVTIDVRVRLFDDCSGDDLPNPHPANAVRLVERTFRATDDWGNVTTCRQLIWVVDFEPFFITDETCNNPNPNDGVIWPCDRDYNTCPDEIPVDYPTVFDDNCSIIGIEYDDQVFYFVDNACYKILRTWSIIDWCQYDPLTGEGYWQYVQVIKVVDNEGPEFEDCPAGPVTLCVENEGVTLPANNQVFLGEGAPGATNCSVHVRVEHTVVEACSETVKYDVKVYPNNGSTFLQVISLTEVPVDSNNNAVLVMDTKNSGILAVRQNGLPYNDRFCSNFPLPGGDKDYHRVLWTVEDGCGNISTCEYLLRLEDCKKPSPVCINGLSSVVMPSAGEVTIWAKDFDASSFDDCTLAEDLKFSFSGTNDYPSAKFACDCSSTTPDYPGQPCFDLATNGSPSFIVEIWVADEGTDDNCNAQISWSERNTDFCTTFIIIDDNEGVCGPNTPITGGIFTEEDDAVGQVKVTLYTASGEYYTHYLTDESGIYHLGITNPTVDWTVVPERLDNPKNGVSTLDLVRIQKHLLGIDKFDSPYKMIAADANNSQSISAVDLVELRKLILGLYTELPENDSWRFVSEEYDIADPTNPWPFNEAFEYEEGMGLNGRDFKGIKIGDVNSTAAANVTQIEVRNTVGTLTLVTDDQLVEAGETIEVTLSAEGVSKLVGYQFTLHTNGLQYESVEAGQSSIQSENIGVLADAITTSWHKIAGIDVNAEAGLFTLSFTATQSGLLSQMLSISSRYTEAEAYDAEEEILNVSLAFRNALASGKEYALHQNEPNPYSDATVISFDLPEAMSATLSVYDVAGKLVKVIEGNYEAGVNKITLNANDLGTSGVLYYTLDADDFTATKKMVIIR